MTKEQELEKVRAESAEMLNRYGYNGEEFASQIVEITAWYRGEPSRVRMKDGIEIFL